MKYSLRILLIGADPDTTSLLSEEIRQVLPTVKVDRISSFGRSHQRLRKKSYHLLIVRGSTIQRKNTEYLRELLGMPGIIPIIFLAHPAGVDQIVDIRHLGVSNVVEIRPGFAKTVAAVAYRLLQEQRRYLLFRDEKPILPSQVLFIRNGLDNAYDFADFLSGASPQFELLSSTDASAVIEQTPESEPPEMIIIGSQAPADVVPLLLSLSQQHLRIPVLVLAANPEKDDIIQYLKLGAAEVFDASKSSAEEIAYRVENDVRKIRYQSVKQRLDQKLALANDTLDAQFQTLAEELQQSQRRLKLFAEHTRDLIAVLDGEGTINYASPSFYYHMGHLQADLKGQLIFELIHPDVVPELRKSVRQLVRNGKPLTHIFQITNKSGDWLLFESRFTRLQRSGNQQVSVVMLSRDITIRRRAETALQASKSRYHKLTQLSPVGIFECDINRYCLYVNDHWVKTAGIDASQALGEGWVSAVHPDDRLAVLDTWNNATRKGIPFKLEYRFQHPDGTTTWVHGEAAIVSSDSGEVSGYIELLLDITERKKTEEALRQSQAQYKQLIEQSPYAVLVHSEGRIVFVNRSSLRLLGGKRRNDFLDKPLLPFIHPHHRDHIVQTIESYDKGFGPLETRFLRLDDKEVDVELSGLPIYFQGKAAGLMVMHNISQRKSTENEIRTLAHAIRSITQGVFIADLDGNLKFVNQAFINMYQFSEDELLGQPFTMIQVEEELVTVNLIAETLSGGWQGNVVHRRKDGSNFPVQLATSLLRDDNNASIALIGVATDISEKISREETLRNAEEQLQQIQKMEALGRMAGGVAHEFNNILTIIKGYGQILHENLEDNPTLRNDIDSILRAGEQGAILTQQLLAVSRRQPAEPEQTNINTIVSEVEPMLQRLIGKDIDMRCILAGELATVRVDRTQIEQILINLCLFARDSIEGRGKITVETANKALGETYPGSETQVRPGKYILLSVSDDGAGMDEETQQHIFEPFYYRKDAKKGSGLGLSTVYGMTKQNDGYIWAYSEQDKGTSFNIYLPRDTEQADTAPETSADATDLSGTETILLIESKDPVRMLADKILRSYGYDVILAADVEEAKRLQKKSPQAVDLLITNVPLNTPAGINLVRSLKSRNSAVRKLYISGFPDQTIVHHGILKPGMSFLQKPFTPEGLGRKVREVLERPRLGTPEITK